MKKFIAILAITLSFSFCTQGYSDIDKRNGEWYWYIPDGFMEGYWIPVAQADSLNGTYHLFYTNGKLCEVHKLRDKTIIDTTFTYDLNGKLDCYQFKVDSNMFEYYLEDGQYIDHKINTDPYLTGTVKNHQRVGKWTWYDDSMVKLTDNIYQDSASYISMNYYPNGQIKDSGLIQNQKQEGTIKFWFDNGKLEEISHYQNGLLHGQSKHFNEKGELLFCAISKSGKLNGKTLYYDEKNQIVKELVFFNDSLISQTIFKDQK